MQDYAREALFEPLGIACTEWECGSNGEAIAASGLRMTPRDLTRIGVAVLGNGRWNERQVIPADRLTAAFTPAVSMPDDRRYGYHGYVGAFPVDDGAGGVRWERW